MCHWRYQEHRLNFERVRRIYRLTSWITRSCPAIFFPIFPNHYYASILILPHSLAPIFILPFLFLFSNTLSNPNHSSASILILPFPLSFSAPNFILTLPLTIPQIIIILFSHCLLSFSCFCSYSPTPTNSQTPTHSPTSTNSPSTIHSHAPIFDLLLLLIFIFPLLLLFSHSHEL